MLILQAFFNIFKLIWCNYYFFFLGLSANNYEVTFIKITSNKKYLEKITRIGTLRAKIIARQNIEIIKNIIGFF